MRSRSAPSTSRAHWLNSMLVGALLLGVTLVATSPASAAPPPSGEAWPSCDDLRTSWCIETFEVDGVDVRTGSDWKLDVSLLDGGNGVNSVNWYLGNTGPDAGPNLSPPATATASKVEVRLNTGDLVPRFTIGYGTGRTGEPFTLHTGGDASTGYTLHAVGYPIEIEWRVADQSCFGGECGGLTTAADVATLAFGGNTQDLEAWDEEYAQQFAGMWIVTDAQYFSYPIFETYPEPHWYLQLGNPHLGVDGVTPQVGEFIARVPAGMLENVGATVVDAVDAGLETHRVQDDTTVEVPSSVVPSLDANGDPDGGVILHVTEFPYSVATLEVGGAAPAEVEPSLTRLAGEDRILTGIAVSQERYPLADTAQTAVLARSDLFPDALAGTPLAALRNGPLLLTDPMALDARVLDELGRVLPPGATVHLLGGETALSAAVEDAVEAAGFTPVRLQGQTRYETAAAIGALLAEDTGRIYLATGRNFPDALGAGAAAAATNGIVLLTDDTVLPEATKQVIAMFAPDMERVAVGAQAAAADPGATSLAGEDRYDTAAKLARYAFAEPMVFGVASGANFPDGLTGGAHVGALAGPLVLVAPDQVPAVVSTWLDEVPTLRTGFVYGGETAVWPTVFSTLEQVLLARGG